jgi:hypothetical protein
MKFNRTFCLLSLLAIGCGKKTTDVNSAEDARQFRETTPKFEACDVQSKSTEQVDANGDGKPEMIRVLSGKGELCRTMDLNFDGRIDRTTFFDESGKERRIESDFDRDGVVDEIAVFEKGVVVEKHRMTTMDGKLDTWEFFKDGKLARTERDENGDGIIDQWWEYPTRGCPLIHVDADGDGRPDPGASIDYCKETGYSPPPIPGESSETANSADFGEKDERVEELSNTQSGDAATPKEPAEVGSDEVAPAQEAAE